MNNVLNYLKFVSIFLILELMITFIASLLNLIGLNSGITTIILLIFNIILFFILSFTNAKLKKKKGLIEGLIIGIIFLFLMFMIKIILFAEGFSISTLIYYVILLLTSILGGLFGVNKKEKD